MNPTFRMVPVKPTDFVSKWTGPEYAVEVIEHLRYLGAVFEGDSPFRVPDEVCVEAITEVRIVVSGLAQLHAAAFGDASNFYINCLLPTLADEELNGDIFNSKIRSLIGSEKFATDKFKTGQRESLMLMMSISGSCAYAVQGLRSVLKKKVEWGVICRATQMLGVAEGIFSRGPGREKEIAAKAAADARWSESPTKEAEELAKSCWDKWKLEPGNYKNQNDFGLDVLSKVSTKKDGTPVITLATIIKNYIPKWQGVAKRKKK
jgi:hypothetical protein